MASRTHHAAARRFLRARSSQLPESASPAVTALLSMARTLDNDGVTASLMGQYMRLWERLDAQAAAAGEADPVEAFISSNGQ